MWWERWWWWRLRSRLLLAAPGPFTTARRCSSCSSSQASRPIMNCGALAATRSGGTYSPNGSSSFSASSCAPGSPGDVAIMDRHPLSLSCGECCYANLPRLFEYAAI